MDRAYGAPRARPGHGPVQGSGPSACGDGARAAPAQAAGRALDRPPASWRPPWPASCSCPRLRATAPPTHATLRYCGPDQLSWFAPDPIHTVAPRGDEHTNPSTRGGVGPASTFAEHEGSVPPYVRTPGSVAGCVGREQSHHLRCRAALRDACARLIADRRRPSLWRRDRHSLLCRSGSACERHHRVACRSCRRCGAGDPRATRVGRATGGLGVARTQPPLGWCTATSNRRGTDACSRQSGGSRAAATPQAGDGSRAAAHRGGLTGPRRCQLRSSPSSTRISSSCASPKVRCW
jgi:hypothetical protein